MFILILILLLFVNPSRATIGANLIEAARDGHMPDIIKWLEHHPVDVKDSSQYSAFMWASISGHLDVMQYLLDQGAKINTRDRVRDVNVLLHMTTLSKLSTLSTFNSHTFNLFLFLYMYFYNSGLPYSSHIGSTGWSHRNSQIFD